MIFPSFSIGSTNEIVDTTLFYWQSGRKIKHTPSGWISGNAPCCHHRGHSFDQRNRGGLLLTSEGGFSWHCFNCGFKTSWHPGWLFSENVKNLFSWLGMDTVQIQKLNLVAMQLKYQLTEAVDDPTTTTTTTTTSSTTIPTFEIERLPPSSKLLTEWCSDPNVDPAYLPYITEAVTYLVDTRGMKLDWYDWYWSPDQSYKNRIIIPYYYRNKIVGYTGRLFKNTKRSSPKYLTIAQPGYLFNIDRQGYKHNKSIVLVVEGQLDAIAIDGVAVSKAEVSRQQATQINLLGVSQTIVVPDRDESGSGLVEAALDHNWSVSFPPWESHIKDVADAVQHYGRAYALYSILHYTETNPLKIKLLQQFYHNEYTTTTPTQKQ